MPMIDIYATTGTFQSVHQLAMDAAAVLKSVERVPDLAIFSFSDFDKDQNIQLPGASESSSAAAGANCAIDERNGKREPP